MALIANVVQETSSSTGTGNFTIAPENGRQRFSEAFPTGGSDTFYYSIMNRSARQWEVGTGSLSDANTLVRDTVLASSNSNALVDFGAGTKDVVNGIPQSDAMLLSDFLNGPGYPVASLAELAALDTTKYTLAYLTEEGRANPYVWTTGNYSFFVGVDEDGYTYVASDDVPSTSGAWIVAHSTKEEKANTSVGRLDNFRWNYVGSGATAYFVDQGNVPQPNLLNVPVYVSTAQGNGATASFNFSPGWTVENESWENIRVVLVTSPLGDEELWSETTDYTVSGYGTGTITITPNSTLSALESIRVRITRKASSGSTPTLCAIAWGYDNVIDGNGDANTIASNHATIEDCVSGHNLIIGGSLGYVHNNSRYTTITGLSNEATDAQSGFAAGQRNTITGTAPVAIGASCYAGSYSVAMGDQCVADDTYSFARGRRGVTKIAAEQVTGVGATADAEAGYVQISNYPLRRQITSTSNTTLNAVTGSATWAMEDSSFAWITGTVLLVDQDKTTSAGATDYKVVSVQAAIDVTEGTAAAGDGTITIICETKTTVEETAGASTWTVDLTTSGRTFFFRGTGATSVNIMALADIKVMFVNKNAT